VPQRLAATENGYSPTQKLQPGSQAVAEGPRSVRSQGRSLSNQATESPSLCGSSVLLVHRETHCPGKPLLVFEPRQSQVRPVLHQLQSAPPIGLFPCASTNALPV